MVKPSKPLQTIRYRSVQFFTALKAILTRPAHHLSAEDALLIQQLLTTAAQRHLFEQMRPNDQQHGLAVVRMLQQAGHHEPALLQAGLLHDMAKALGQPLLHRVLIVLLEMVRPSLLTQLSAWSQPINAPNLDRAAQMMAHIPAWRRPFIIRAHHPEIGATWAEAAQFNQLTVRLIARHQQKINLNPEEITNEQKLRKTVENRRLSLSKSTSTSSACVTPDL